MRFFKYTFSECIKIYSNKSLRIVLPIILIIQPAFGYLVSKQLVSMGLNATPETNSALLEAVPPKEYIGFDTILLGLFAMIILGANLGGLEFKKNSLRTSLLLIPNKLHLFITKYIAISVIVFVASFLSIYVTINFSQLALGNQGLNLFVLNSQAWLFVLLGSISWTFLTLLSYVIAFGFRSSVISLVFLIPQIYNLGEFLAGKIFLAKFLPVALSQDLIATSPLRFNHNYWESIFLLGIWVVIVTYVALYRFQKLDLGE